MKTGIFGIVIVLFLVAGCSKNNTAPSAAVNAFVGNYHMYDSTSYGGGAGGSAGTRYDINIAALSGSSNQIVCTNIGNFGVRDTGTVSGTLATFANSGNLTTASISGSTITLNGGVYFTSGNSFKTGTGTKF